MLPYFQNLLQYMDIAVIDAIKCKQDTGDTRHWLDLISISSLMWSESTELENIVSL